MTRVAIVIQTREALPDGTRAAAEMTARGMHVRLTALYDQRVSPSFRDSDWLSEKSTAGVPSVNDENGFGLRHESLEEIAEILRKADLVIPF